MLTGFARRTMSTAQQMKVPDNADYSKFQHASTYHARMPCLLCHRRDSNAASPTMPGAAKHAPCAGCHVKQFADSASAICTICHDNVQAGTLKAFPSLSSFSMRFDHAQHTGRVSCVSCHRPARGGVAMTVPNGSAAHVACFQCHGPQAKSEGRDISSCGVCHVPGNNNARSSRMAAAIRIGFSHGEHNRNEGLNCNDCHRVRAGAQSDGVSAPQLLNHHASANSFSCRSCHNGKRAFGDDDFSVCKRCHQGSAWRF
jgi:c(7)-type cytochrome triheme protein